MPFLVAGVAFGVGAGAVQQPVHGPGANGFARPGLSTVTFGAGQHEIQAIETRCPPRSTANSRSELCDNARVDTRSDEHSTTSAGTAKQLDLPRLLVDELRSICAADVRPMRVSRRSGRRASATRRAALASEDGVGNGPGLKGSRMTAVSHPTPASARQGASTATWLPLAVIRLTRARVSFNTRRPARGPAPEKQ